jgi:hypothetical protein
MMESFQESLEADTLYYVYVKQPTSGTTIGESDVVASIDVATFDEDKSGYYRPGFSDHRAIAYFTTDGDGHVPDEFSIPGAVAPSGGGDFLVMQVFS